MTKTLRVGIVGCGEIAQTVHIPLLVEMKDFKVVAICDISTKVRSELAERYSIEHTYENYTDLVNQTEIDVVLVSNRDHAPVSIAAMNAGKHVLVEKPMAYNLEEAYEMVETANRNQVKLMVGYMKRYDPAFEYALEQIKTIQKPHLIRIHDFAGDFTINHEIFDQIYSNDLDIAIKKSSLLDELAKMKLGIGDSHVSYVDAYSNLLYLLIHDLILLNTAFGLPDEVLYTEIFNKSSIISVLKYGDGTRCIIEGGLILNRREWDEQFAVYGDNKRVEIHFPYPYTKNVPAILYINEQEGSANIEKKVLVSYEMAFKREWRHFYECIVEDREPITSGRQSLQELQLITRIIKSVKPERD